MAKDELVLIIDKSGSRDMIKEDAIGGRTVDRVGERLDELDESDKPENVIVFILTDAKENASSDYSRDKVKEMI